jgi:hypothetical protein
MLASFLKVVPPRLGSALAELFCRFSGRRVLAAANRTSRSPQVREDLPSLFSSFLFVGPRS